MGRPLRLGVLLGVLISAIAAAPAQAQTPQLHWPLDDVGGATTPDISGNGFNGPLTRTDGAKPDGRFDGAFNTRTSPTNAQIRLPGSAALQPQQFTVVAWVRAQPSAFANERGVIDYVTDSCSATIWAFRNQETDLRFRVNGGGVSVIDNEDVYDGRWHMIAATVDGRRHTAYLDGAPIRTTNQPAPGALDYGTGTKTLSVGASACEASGLRDTDLDEIRLYNSNLTAAQIAYMSRSRLADPPELPVPPNDPGWSGLLGQWHLDGTNFDGITGSSGEFELSGPTDREHVTGRFGRALNHVNASSGLQAPDSTNLEPTTVTLMAWVKAAASPGNDRVIAAKGSVSGPVCPANTYGFDTGAAGGIRFRVVVRTAGVPQIVEVQGPAAGAIWNNQWHAVTGTYDNSKITIWVDGVKVGTTNVPAASSLNHADDAGFGLRTGGDPNTACTSRAFVGLNADEVRVYNRVLFDDEIVYLQDAAATTPRDLPTPARAPEPGPVNLTRPVISGSPTSTGANALVCDPGTWTGSPSGYTYLWERGMRQATTDGDPSWAPINGASGQNYAPSGADAGLRVRCRVIAANFRGSGEAVSESKRTDPSRPFVQIAPSVTGFPAADQTLTCNPGEWSNVPTFSYQWFRQGVGDIPGATGQSYKPIQRYAGRELVNRNGDGNHKIGCRVVADNDVGASDPSSSAPRLVIDGSPVIETRPTLTLEDRGNNIGRKATCTAGTYLNWTPDEPEFSASYEWLRNGVVIGGVSGRVYTTVAEDLGTDLSCQVTVRNAFGESTDPSAAKVISLPGFNIVSRVPVNYSFRSRANQFDPVNMMMLPQPYAGTLTKVVTERLTAEVKAETGKCRKLGVGLAAPTQAAPPKFPLSVEVRCSILLKDPTGFAVTYNGVQWTRGQFCTVGAEQGSGACPDMGFVIPPLDPTSSTTMNPALEAELKANEPEKVLWDFNNDGKTDLICPGSAPVARALFKPGQSRVSAVITFADSGTTGRYGVSADYSYSVPGSERGKPAPQIKFREPTQPMWCRTSVVPPPDPKSGPCADRGEVGGIKLEGNLCPINLRATDQRAFDGLDPEVIDVLDRAALAIAKAEKDAETAESNPKLVAKSTRVMLSRTAPETRYFNPLKPGDALPAPLRKASLSVLTARAAASSYTGLVTSLPGKLPYFGAEAYVQDSFAKNIPKFVEEKGQFALDQIYAVKGDLDMNGVTIDPVDDDLPTLIVPSDAGEAITYARDPKKLVVNAKNAVTKMAVQKLKDGVKETVGDIPLSPKEGINQLLSDTPGAPLQTLKENINLDQLRQSFGDKLDMGPFKLAGTSAKIKLQSNGTALIEAEAELVGLENSPGNLLRTKVTLLGDLDGNLQLQGVKLEQKKDTVAFLLGIRLQKLFLEYNPTGGLTVRGQLTFDWAGGQGIDIRNFSLGPDGEFRALDVDYLAGVGTGIMIAPGVFLTKLGGGLYTEPETAIRAGAAVSAIAPSAGGGCPTVGTEGDVTVKWKPQPFLVHVVGRVGVVCIPIGKLELKASTDGVVEIKGDWGVDLKVIKMNAVLDGYVQTDPNLWQIGYGVRGELPFLSTFLKTAAVSINGVLSNRGLAACANFLGIDAGIGVHFSNGRPPFTYTEFLANLRPFFLGCGLEDFASLPLRAAQSPGGPRSFDVKESEPTMLSIEGPGDAPKVRLRSPDGKVLDFSDAVGGKQAENTLGVILDDEDRTAVLMPKPAKGTWTVEPVEGSAPVVAVRMAGIAPKPSVKGRVTGKGSTRTLTYDIKNIKDQVVNFIEEAEGGHKVVKTVRGGGTGKVTYTVDETRSTVRELKAMVVHNDMPRAEIVIARYRAPNPKVGKPKVRIRRRGSRAVVTWGRAALARDYLVTVMTGTGERYSVQPKRGKRTVTLAGIGKKGAVSVSVRAVSDGGRQGPAGKAKLSKPKKKKRK
jgi:hypothetical protein